MKLSKIGEQVGRKPGLPALLLLACFGATLGLAGGTASAAELTPQQKQEMKILYERATRAYDVGKYNEAIEEYQKAYEIGGDPPMLYNIAQAYRLNDQPGEALRFYRRYLQRAPNARNREDVERKIAELEKTVEDRRKAQAAAPPPVTTPPPTTTPITPVAPPAVTPPSLVGPPAPGVAPPATVPAPVTEVPTTPAPAAEPQGTSTRTIVSWIVVGAGVALGGAALYEGKVAQDKADSVGNMSRLTPAVPFDPTPEKAGKNASTAAIVLGIAGGAAVATGVILLLTGGSSTEAASEPAAPVPTARATVAPWLGGGIVGAGANIRF
jgi:hypothetical protein